MKTYKASIFYWYILLVLAYACLTLLPAPAAETLRHYHIDATRLRGLYSTFIVFEAIIWFAAFYGYYKLRAYSRLIKTNQDGRQVNKLAGGLLALAIGFPLSSILSALLELIGRHQAGLATAAPIISHYLSVAYPLIAFILLSRGARGLTDISKLRLSLRTINVLGLSVIILGTFFCFLVAHSHHDIRESYHMSYGLVMLTLGIPYMYIWFLGLFSVTQIQQYSRNLTGILYRKSWNLVAGGLGSILVFSIIIQYLGTLSTWLTGLSLSWILLLLYALLLLLAASYIVVALGAKRLMKIEEV
jgi:hypothetical protein